MNQASYRILAYRPEYEAELTALERAAPQGSLVELELVKDRFLSRATVFDHYRVYLAVDEEGRLAGVCGGAIVPIAVNECPEKAGLLFDLKVAPAHRRRGVAQQLLLHLREQFFQPEQVSHFFTTAKATNTTVRRLEWIAKRPIYSTPFVYLTVPTYARLPKRKLSAEPPDFRVGLFDRVATGAGYEAIAGWGVWRTHAMYQIRIRQMRWWLRAAIALANRLRTANRRLPEQGDLIRFATLFDTTNGDPGSLHAVLQQLADAGTHYLSVCCRSGDERYRYFHRRAIFTYDYLLLTTLPVDTETKITIDVRCL